MAADAGTRFRFLPTTIGSARLHSSFGHTVKPQTQLERLVAEIERRGALVDELVCATDRLPVSLPYPSLFTELLARHSFIPFEAGGVRVFSNLRSEEDNLEHLLADNILTGALVGAGFLPFGRPATGSYDRVCFDVRGKRHPLDTAVVLMDHEAVLSHNQTPKPRTLALGIMQLVAEPGAAPMVAPQRALATRGLWRGRHR